MGGMKRVICWGVILASVPMWAATYTWTGAAGDGKWEAAGNWENNVIPVSKSDTVIILSTQEGRPDIVKAGGEFFCARLEIAAGSAALKLSGGTFRLSTFGNYTQTDVSQVTPAFHCRATGVPVEIASDLILTGERHFL